MGLEGISRDDEWLDSPLLSVDVDFGLQAKHVGDRFSNDINTEVAPNYTTADLDIRYNLANVGNGSSYIQLNVINLFDEKYYTYAVRSAFTPDRYSVYPLPERAFGLSVELRL